MRPCGATGTTRACGVCEACKLREGRMAAEARAARRAGKGLARTRGQQLASATATAAAHARSSDPETSHQAAATVDITENQRALLVVLRTQGEFLLDEQIIKAYNRARKAFQLPEQSESGLRSRRAELERMGRLEEGEKQRMKTGGLGRTWRLKTSTTTTKENA